MRLKVSIIGGGGRVGSNAAYALQLGGLVQELALVDVNREQAEGEALDLRHGAALSGGAKRIYAGGPEAVEGSDIVLITAGLRRLPDESRFDLMHRNAGLFSSILEGIRRVRLPADATLVVVSNPVDIMTHLAVESGIFPPHRVVGLGTLLDTTRFRSLLAEHFNVNPRSVDALILGEHGDSMVPIWSTATINGATLQGFPGYDEEKVHAVFDFTNNSGAEVLRLKGGAGYAVGLAVRELIDAIILDRRSVLPVSTLQNGMLGIRDVCMSLPTIIGRAGVKGVVEIAASESEKDALRDSANIIKENRRRIS